MIKKTVWLIIMAAALVIVVRKIHSRINAFSWLLKKPAPEKVLTAAASPTPLSPPVSQIKELTLAEFFYPGAETVRLSGKTLMLKSGSSPEGVTAWYKKKITDFGLNTRSFIQTNTNGDIANRLVGADKRGKVKIEIDKEKSAPLVEISVTLGGSNE